MQDAQRMQMRQAARNVQPKFDQLARLQWRSGFPVDLQESVCKWAHMERMIIEMYEKKLSNNERIGNGFK